MKEKISLYLVATVKRIGALWVGFLVCIVPLYIIRGNIHDLDDLAIVGQTANLQPLLRKIQNITTLRRVTPRAILRQS